ncbi:KAP family NTPase [Bacillus mycoides]|uniref:KAP family NTPase n=1 Tax=Bacillus mycoides TaxID=1405 RepID=UPI001F091AB8|nr:KAP family NTPase [Bacillus mycoides]
MPAATSESMEYTIDSILDYIESGITEYAILLNGRWGSGKTYFWEYVLKEKIEATGKKTIYVSLYGINSIDEISKRIALGRWGIVQKINDNKWGGRVTELAKATFGILKNVEIPFVKDTQLPGINFEQFIDFTDTVLCFDDLERADISVNEILGYINNFVEHDSIKVIIIGNENEIDEKLNEQNLELKMLTTYFYLEKTKEGKLDNIQSSAKEQITINNVITDKLRDLFHKKNEYKRIKEKLIGKTLTIQLDEGPLIQDIINETKETKLHSFLEHNIDIIETTFKESETKNIRILKQGLNDFTLIHKYFEKYDYTSNVMLQSILKFVLAVSFAIKTNMPNNEELEEINSHDDFITVIGLSGILGDTAKKFPGEFQKKYYNGQGTLYKRKFLKFAEVLIRKGIFDKELFKVEMDNFQLELDGTKSKDLHIEFILGEYWNLSDDEFLVAEQSTYNKLKNGELDFAWYFRAYQTYEFCMRNKMISRDIKEMKRDLMKGLEKSGGIGEYTEYAHYMFYRDENRDDKNLDEFKDKIIEINNDLKMEKEKENVQILMNLMRTDSYQFYLKMTDYYKYNPFFVYCDSEELYDNIINLSADGINVVRGLIEVRIQLVDDNQNSHLQMELPNLNKIKCRLNDEINAQKKTPRLVLLEYLVKDIEEFKKKIESLNNASQLTL